jgi:hypothetical protein
MTAAADFYRASPITRRRRRSKAEIAEIKATIFTIVQVDRPMTVRQVFYRLVSTGLIAKSENEYNQTACRLLVEMRKSREIPYGWIADGTRWVRHAETFDGVDDALERVARFYRRGLWANQDERVEVWLEKEALAGVLVDETDEYDVPLYVTRGYPSLSYLYEAAQSIAAAAKPTTILYFGDHDPSGIHIPINILERLHDFVPDADIELERVAVTPAQIVSMRLQTRPTKTSDSRSRDFDGESVEVDAIRPATLRDLCREAIELHVDDRALGIVRIAEESERSILEAIAAARG